MTQASVVQKVDSGTGQINHYSVVNALGFLIIIHQIAIYPVNRTIQLLNKWGLIYLQLTSSGLSPLLSIRRFFTSGDFPSR